MKKISNAVILVLFVFFPLATASAFSGSEVHITKNGVTSVSAAKVMQIAGSTFFARLYWGSAFLRFTISTGNNTKFFRATNEPTILSEIKEGDLLDVSGELQSGGDTIVLVASVVKNSSVNKKQIVFSGYVINLDLIKRTFSMEMPSGAITVLTGTTTQFLKGSRTLDLEHVVVGDKIQKVSGDYDLNTKTLIAQSVTTYVDMNYYKPQNFEGVLKSVSGTTPPASIVVTIGKIDYTVNLTLKTSIISKNRSSTVLNRFVVGDRVRIYGVIREVDSPIIDAEIIRNMNL